LKGRVFADKYFEEFGNLVLMKDEGLCPRCHAENSLRLLVDEAGVHGVLCKKCGWTKKTG